MDSRFRNQGFDGHLYSLNTSENQSTVAARFTPLMDTSLTLGSPGATYLYNSSSNRNKRKWSDVGGNELSEDDFSLVLGLGRSSSSSDSSKMSSTTAFSVSSAKETDEETSMDLELNFQLHLGSDSEPIPKKPNVVAETISRIVPVSDLQLCFSGPYTSVVTSMCPTSTCNPKSLETYLSINCSVPLDDGSTSSRWKSGDLVLKYINSTQTVNNFAPNRTITTIGGICASGTTITPVQRNSCTKMCQFLCCQTGARGASGLCIAHGRGRRCKRDGCQRGAEGRTAFCKAHGRGRRCEYLGCTKSAEGHTDYCIGHGGGIRCSHEGCTHASRGKTGFCIKHGGGKRCQKEECNKSAEDHTGLCISHGGGPRCQFPCKNGAQWSTVFCKRHGGGKRCTFPECRKGAEGHTLFCKGHGGGKRCTFQGGDICSRRVHGWTQFCVNHGGGKRCALSECTSSAMGQTAFCVNHGRGRWCKSEGCNKGAQGITDFCKGHGGGKRCLWGKDTSDLGIEGPPCHRHPLSGNNFCAIHTALVQDLQVHGGDTVGSDVIQDAWLRAPQKLGETVAAEDLFTGSENHGKTFISWDSFGHKFGPEAIPQQSSGVSIPEGRVHGGSLMSLLSSNATVVSQANALSGAGPSGQSAAPVMPHKWV